MLHTLKRRLYFIVARYFRFWARFGLKRWQPRIIAVTGSAGKTTLLHMVEAQLGDKAHYSHHANSAYGISFDILGLGQVRSSRLDWLGLALRAPFKALSTKHLEQFYVVEIDADRRHEAKFIAQLIHPEVTLWVSSLHTHTHGFDESVRSGDFKTPEEAIAYEYGYILAATSGLVTLDGDNGQAVAQSSRTTAQVQQITKRDLSDYKLGKTSTSFTLHGQHYQLPALVPQATFYQLAMVEALMNYLKLPIDRNYERFVMPPGRSNVLAGLKGVTIIDSTYNNSNLDSMREVIELFAHYPAQHKWLIVGDLLEQGKDEAREHQALAKILNDTDFERLLLVGRRLQTYTLPELSSEITKREHTVNFTSAPELLTYLTRELSGQETLLFKGVGFLEGVIEKLLAEPSDAAKLVRREPIHAKHRKALGI